MIGLYLWHDEQIAKVGVSCTTQMGMTETHDSTIGVLIAGTILIHFTLVTAIHVMGNGICFGTQLYNSERRASTWESMSHPVGTNDGVHIVQHPFPLGE